MTKLNNIFKKKKIDKKASIVFAEIDVSKFAALVNESITYAEPSKYPEIEIDLSFISDKYEPIAQAIEAAKSPLIKKVEVVDVYREENAKSITTRITFSHPEKTLTREEVMEIADGIIADLDKKGIALKK